MLSLSLSDFTVELKDGAIKNVGPSNKTASAKLFDVADVEAREFGDKRVKLAFEDDDGNTVEVALFPEDVAALTADVESLRDDSPVFE